jgi:hypothetical protein
MGGAFMPGPMPEQTSDWAALRGLRRYGLWLVAAASVFVLASAIGLALLRDAKPDTVRFETARTLLQLLIVGFGGAVLRFLASQYQARQVDVENERERLRQAESHDRELLRSVLNRATTSYNGVKRARRLLRARARQQHRHRTFVMADAYDTQLALLNDIQLEFETLSGEVETEQTLFTGSRELQRLFDDLETYLGDIIAEYEIQRPRFGTRLSIDQRALTKLTDFLDRSDFRHFSERFHQVQEQLRKDLVARHG